MAKKTKSGGKLSRTEVTTVRFDPKLKYLADLIARTQRRTLSSFIEWAVEKAVKETDIGCPVGNDNPISAWDAQNLVWDTDEADRLIKLAKNFPELMNFEEQKIWKLIETNPYFWKLREKSDSKLDWNPKEGDIEKKIIKDHVRKQWERLNKVINDEIDISEIPDNPVSKYNEDFEIEEDQYYSKKKFEEDGEHDLVDELFENNE